MGHWSPAIGLSISVSICWLCGRSADFAKASPIVQIKNGTLEGAIMKARKGREFVSFRSIPYAQPPIGELRFEPPKPFDSWTGVRSAEEDANICPQRDTINNWENIVGDEDCLYLNVYTPKLPNDGNLTRTNYPVMIFLHGGMWSQGSSHSGFYGPKFFLDHDIVLVTVNYRLGPLGFLSTEDLVSSGNQGLKDQAQAIRWVHENIAPFGGDYNRITIFGHSAGAASVHYQMISPLSRGHFHRGISQSGAIYAPWALTRPKIARSRANRLGQLLDCPTDESKALIDCLRKKEPADFVTSDRAFQVFGICPMVPFGPVIEPDHPGAFLKEEPTKSLKSGNMVDIPWITGITSHEGAMKSAVIYERKDKEYDKLLDEKFMKLAPISLLYEYSCPEKFKDNVTRSIREFYLGNKKIDESMKMNITNLYTDAWVNIGADNAVRVHLEAYSSPTYYYYFAYKGSSSFSSLIATAEKDYGVTHGDDLQYFFPVNEVLFPKTPLSKEDRKMVDVMIGLWVNFAKLGNPTPVKTPDVPVKWKPVRTSSLEYLHIGGTKDLRMAANLLPDRVNFWASIPYRGKIELEDDPNRHRDEL